MSSGPIMQNSTPESAIDDNSIIHTMPKKFVTSHPIAQNHQHMGILILVVGIFILIIGLGGLYYFLDKTNFFGHQTVTPVVTEKATTTDQVKKEPAKVDTVSPKEDEITTTTVATSTPASQAQTVEAIIATTTDIADEFATTTDQTAGTGAVTAQAEIKNDIDSDSDGLSDLEEALLNTNPAIAYSDDDSYTDLAELKSLYNPAGQGKIIVNPSIEKYTNSKFQYSLYYPKIWEITSLVDADSVIWQLANGQFIQVIVQANIEQLTIEDWYKKQFGQYSLKPSQVILKKGWTAIQSEDGLVYYLINPNDKNIYTVNYNLGITNITSYKNIFDMMVMSLELKN